MVEDFSKYIFTSGLALPNLQFEEFRYRMYIRSSENNSNLAKKGCKFYGFQVVIHPDKAFLTDLSFEHWSTSSKYSMPYIQLGPEIESRNQVRLFMLPFDPRKAKSEMVQFNRVFKPYEPVKTKDELKQGFLEYEENLLGKAVMDLFSFPTTLNAWFGYNYLYTPSGLGLGILRGKYYKIQSIQCGSACIDSLFLHPLQFFFFSRYNIPLAFQGSNQDFIRLLKSNGISERNNFKTILEYYNYFQASDGSELFTKDDTPIAYSEPQFVWKYAKNDGQEQLIPRILTILGGVHVIPPVFFASEFGDLKRSYYLTLASNTAANVFIKMFDIPIQYTGVFPNQMFCPLFDLIHRISKLPFLYEVLSFDDIMVNFVKYTPKFDKSYNIVEENDLVLGFKKMTTGPTKSSLCARPSPTTEDMRQYLALQKIFHDGYQKIEVGDYIGDYRINAHNSENAGSQEPFPVDTLAYLKQKNILPPPNWNYDISISAFMQYHTLINLMVPFVLENYNTKRTMLVEKELFVSIVFDIFKTWCSFVSLNSDFLLRSLGRLTLDSGYNILDEIGGQTLETALSKFEPAYQNSVEASVVRGNYLSCRDEFFRSVNNMCLHGAVILALFKIGENIPENLISFKGDYRRGPRSGSVYFMDNAISMTMFASRIPLTPVVYR